MAPVLCVKLSTLYFSTKQHCLANEMNFYTFMNMSYLRLHFCINFY